jgi:hypothetical protein
MKLYVPEIGDHLRLTADWTFVLHNEYRNRSLWDHFDCDNAPEVRQQVAEKKLLHDELSKLGQKMLRDELSKLGQKMYPTATSYDPVDVARREELHQLIRPDEHATVTISAGAVLSVDRIFIRKGMDDWSSLTFFLKELPGATFKKKPRFWAKLHDCNNIEFDQVKI